MDTAFIMRMRTLVEEHANGVYTRLAKALGVSPTTMQRYLEGQALPGYNTLCRLYRVFDVTPNWLLFGWEPKYRDEATNGSGIRVITDENIDKLTERDFTTVPIVTQEAWSSGAPGVTTIGCKTITGYALAAATAGQRLFSVCTPDDSMVPEIEAGDLVIVDGARQDLLLLENHLVLAQCEGVVSPRRLMQGVLFTNNPRHFPPMRATKHNVLGAIVQMQRSAHPMLTEAAAMPLPPSKN